MNTRGAILVGGSGASEAALRRAASLQAQGVIVGSLEPRWRELAQNLDLPIIVTEGFGASDVRADL